MPTLKATINLELNGVSVAGFPVVKRLELDESQEFRYEKVDDTNGTTFIAVPTAQIASIQALIVQADQQLTFRFDGQTDAGILLNAGGLILVMDATIDASAATNLTVNNNVQPTANITGLAAGT